MKKIRIDDEVYEKLKAIQWIERKRNTNSTIDVLIETWKKAKLQENEKLIEKYVSYIESQKEGGNII